MIRVEFHILYHPRNACDIYFAKLIEKIYLLKKKLFIYTQDVSMSEALDDLLWRLPEGSFLPHHIATENAPSAPILINHTPIMTTCDVLINLIPSVPEFCTNYGHIIEFVYEEEMSKKIGREKYRQYQKLNCELHTFHNKENMIL